MKITRARKMQHRFGAKLCGVLIASCSIVSFGGRYLLREQQKMELSTELIMAVRDTDVHTVTDLLKEGADPNTNLSQDIPHSMWERIVRAFKRKRNKGTYSALQLATDPQRVDPDSLVNELQKNAERIQIMKALLLHGANVNYLDTNGFSALIYAAESGQDEELKLLITYGANVNIIDRAGCTALIYLVDNNNLAMTSLILQHGADVNVRDKSQMTPIMYALKDSRSSIAIIKALLSYGANTKHALLYLDEQGNYKEKLAVMKSAGAQE